MGAAGEIGIVFLDVKLIPHGEIADVNRFRQIGDDDLGGRRVHILFADHDPADIVQHRIAALVDTHRTHIDDTGFAVLVFPKADHRRRGRDRIAGIDRLAKFAAGVSQVGDGVEGNVRDGLAEDHMEREHIVHRRPLEPKRRPRELARRVDREAGSVERRIQRNVAVGDRPRRRVDDLLAQFKVLEVIARIGFSAHRCTRKIIAGRPPAPLCFFFLVVA